MKKKSWSWFFFTICALFLCIIFLKEKIEKIIYTGFKKTRVHIWWKSYIYICMRWYLVKFRVCVPIQFIKKTSGFCSLGLIMSISCLYIFCLYVYINSLYVYIQAFSNFIYTVYGGDKWLSPKSLTWDTRHHGCRLRNWRASAGGWAGSTNYPTIFFFSGIHVGERYCDTTECKEMMEIPDLYWTRPRHSSTWPSPVVDA